MKVKDSCSKSTSDAEDLVVGLVRIGLRLRLRGAIYRPCSFVLILRYCANLKAIRYESKSLNKIVASKLHRVIVDEKEPCSLRFEAVAASP